jgi:hypothetical protein
VALAVELILEVVAPMAERLILVVEPIRTVPLDRLAILILILVLVLVLLRLLIQCEEFSA